MDKFVKTTKIKLIIMALSTILPILFILFGSNISKQIGKVEWDMIIIRYIIFVFFEAIIIFKVAVYIKILTQPEYAEHIMIKRKDERVIFLKQKTFTFEYKLILFILACGLVITGFINEFIFYTLLAVMGFVILSAAVVKVYYSKKY